MGDEATVTVHELREHLAEHLDRVRSGECLTVTADGDPIARLVPSPAPAPERLPRKAGFMKGEIWLAPDWDETPQDVLDSIDADLFPHENPQRQ